MVTLPSNNWAHSCLTLFGVIQAYGEYGGIQIHRGCTDVWGAYRCMGGCKDVWGAYRCIGGMYRCMGNVQKSGEHTDVWGTYRHIGDIQIYGVTGVGVIQTSPNIQTGRHTPTCLLSTPGYLFLINFTFFFHIGTYC